MLIQKLVNAEQSISHVPSHSYFKLQAFLEVANAVKLRRSQATSIRLVSLTGELMEAAQHANAAAAAAIGPATAFHRPVSSGHGQQDGPLVSVVDLHSDPWGWRAASSPSTSGPSPGAGPCNAIDPHASTGTPGLAGQPPGVQLLTSLEEMKAAILQQPGEGLRGLAAGTGAGPAAAAAAAAGGGKPAGVGGGVAGAGGGAGAAGGGGGDGGAGGGEAGQRRRLGVVVDCLSTLMQRYGEWQVCRAYRQGDKVTECARGKGGKLHCHPCLGSGTHQPEPPLEHNNNEGGRYLMVTDKPLRPRSCAGPIRAGVRRPLEHAAIGGSRGQGAGRSDPWSQPSRLQRAFAAPARAAARGMLSATPTPLHSDASP